MKVILATEFNNFEKGTSGFVLIGCSLSTPRLGLSQREASASVLGGGIFNAEGEFRFPMFANVEF